MTDGAKPADFLDLRGLNCPLPVLMTSRRLRRMEAGERLTVETTDGLAPIDIPAFCSQAGHRLIALDPIEGGHRFLIEKGARPTPDRPPD